MTEQLKRILLITSAEDAEHVQINEDLVRELNQNLENDATTIEWCNYHDIRLDFSTNELRVSRISTGEDLSVYGYVYFKSYFRYVEEATAIAAYLDSKGVGFVCSELRTYIPQTKVTQFTRMALAGIPIIKSIHLHHSRYRSSYEMLASELGDVFIFKCTDGGGGARNFLIHSEQELIAAVDEFPNMPFVAQKFVENDSDLRILLVGDEVRLIIRRIRAENTHMNNTSQGGAAELLPLEYLPAEYHELALQSARLMGRETSGVDLMFETGTGDPFILEVNASPQIGSGAFREEKLQIYCNYFRNVIQ
ncbi:MAG: ATP-grasp domain-containing protein [Candidatus Saccharimonadales bacterium]